MRTLPHDRIFLFQCRLAGRGHHGITDSRVP
jgi:hypothetical protein